MTTARNFKPPMVGQIMCLSCLQTQILSSVAMSSTLDIYIGFGNRRGNDTLHWILMLATPGTDRCTWYHVTGGPTQARGYTLQIQANKRLNSFGLSGKRFISTIPASEINKIKSAAQSVPLQRCQRWTTAVLGQLEAKRLVPPGTMAEFESQIEPSRFEQSGSRDPSSGSRSGIRSGSSSGSGTGSRQSGSPRGSSGIGSRYQSSQYSLQYR
ncbi:conserved hypothetical protein [Talaromyces stipitatus ATCC 10500]|uniref:Uncharacterized protein n=1 Tax=Talaromyces stipitatus (strain ATCC 10500 / CBS 375.48 / QM 6759 / NRRL 1006) TaxID=441959 RepID=B8M767_TALSN|nr:uncharacterized protein TSTA_035160 [Talaromyces stipitatus ATCC 10500]EED20287.1 conserved hypothetical protein [Talaromyces stipitatus ATCC 10500]